MSKECFALSPLSMMDWIWLKICCSDTTAIMLSCILMKIPAYYEFDFMQEVGNPHFGSYEPSPLW